MMIVVFLFALVALVRAATSFSQYSMVLFSSATGNMTIGFDASNSRQASQGRAAVVVKDATFVMASYASFNTTFTWRQTNPTVCLFASTGNTALLTPLFNLDLIMLLGTASTLNGDTVYKLQFDSAQSFPRLVLNGYFQYDTNLVVKVTFVGSSLVPKAFSLSSSYVRYDWKVLAFSNYAVGVGLVDGDFAPPNNKCLTPQYRCASSGAVVDTFYRSHGNNSFAFSLDNMNVATSAGEAYFLCSGWASDFVTQFTVRVDTAWNLYARCNKGECLFYERVNSFSFGDVIGVGREVSSGGPSIIDSLGQCDTPAQDRHTGYWFSLNSLGACPVGSRIGVNNCTWERSYKVIKTITKTCAMTNVNCRGSSGDWSTEGVAIENAFVTCPAVSIMAETPLEQWRRDREKQRRRRND